jgi:hypothetical protein
VILVGIFVQIRCQCGIKNGQKNKPRKDFSFSSRAKVYISIKAQI